MVFPDELVQFYLIEFMVRRRIFQEKMDHNKQVTATGLNTDVRKSEEFRFDCTSSM